LNTGGSLSVTGTNDDEAINQLENQLEEIEKKLINTQNEYEILQNEYMDLQDRMYLSKEKYKRAALLLTDFLDDIINSTPNILQTDKDLLANLEKM
jgi:predicted  nucleic acid-binding Zn-ribbon protein